MSNAIFFIIRFRIVKFLFFRIKFVVIVSKCNCDISTIYHIQKNFFVYDSSFKFAFRKRDCFHKITKTTKKSLRQYVENQSWIQQKKMIWYLWKKWNLNVHRFTMFRFLKQMKSNLKKNRRVKNRQNVEFRLIWIINLLNITIEQIVIIDEFNFNEITNWRRQMYVSIKQSDKYHDDVTRNKFWNVFFVYTIDDYLCVNVKKNYFSIEIFFRWIVNELLFRCNVYFVFRNVIIMNNVNIHCNFRIEQIIR